MGEGGGREGGGPLLSFCSTKPKSVVRDLTITAFSNKYTFFSYILTVGLPKSGGKKSRGGVDIYIGEEWVNGLF